MLYFSKWYGEWNKKELVKFLSLAGIFALIVGTYWFLRPIKDGVFITLIGSKYLPMAQFISLFVIIPVIIIYGKLVDILSREKLFYVLCTVFGVISLIFAYFLFGLDINNGLSLAKTTGFHKILGFSFYIYVKIFGSVLIALFWAFVSDITKPNSAKLGYGIIAAGGQLGNLFGSTFVCKKAICYGASKLALISSVNIFIIAFAIKLFIKFIPKESLGGFKSRSKLNKTSDKPKKIKLTDGLSLLLSQKYLLSIFGTIAAYELVQAIFDFRFKTLAGLTYSGDALISYLGQFGALTGLIALIWLGLGISNITRYLGLKVSLVLFPLILIILLLVSGFSSSLLAAMWVIILARSINYSLNQPSKEQLYIVTSRATKYKAKAWIEVFGTRITEATAHIINVSQGFMGSYFILFSNYFTAIILALWACVALYLGKEHSKAIKEDKLIC